MDTDEAQWNAVDEKELCLFIQKNITKKEEICQLTLSVSAVILEVVMQVCNEMCVPVYNHII